MPHYSQLPEFDRIQEDARIDNRGFDKFLAYTLSSKVSDESMHTDVRMLDTENYWYKKMYNDKKLVVNFLNDVEERNPPTRIRQLDTRRASELIDPITSDSDKQKLRDTIKQQYYGMYKQLRPFERANGVDKGTHNYDIANPVHHLSVRRRVEELRVLEGLGIAEGGYEHDATGALLIPPPNEMPRPTPN